MDLLLSKALFAAVEAGKEILKIYTTGTDFEVESKEDQSPLTIADKASHRIIADLLSGEYPILSEEGRSIPWEERKEWKRFWLVDPLDGTKEFIKRNGEFTVNIALIEDGNPIMGVIYVPVSGALYYGDENGSFECKVEPQEADYLDRIEENSIPLPYQKTTDNYIIVGSRSHLNRETEEYIQSVDKKGRPLEMVGIGSSLKFCLVASGKADLYPRLGPTMEWDMAAGHAIAKFAGMKVCQYNNQPMKYNKKELLNPWFIVEREK